MSMSHTILNALGTGKSLETSVKRPAGNGAAVDFRTLETLSDHPVLSAFREQRDPLQRDWADCHKTLETARLALEMAQEQVAAELANGLPYRRPENEIAALADAEGRLNSFCAALESLKKREEQMREEIRAELTARMEAARAAKAIELSSQLDKAMAINAEINEVEQHMQRLLGPAAVRHSLKFGGVTVHSPGESQVHFWRRDLRTYGVFPFED